MQQRNGPPPAGSRSSARLPVFLAAAFVVAAGTVVALMLLGEDEIVARVALAEARARAGDADGLLALTALGDRPFDVTWPGGAARVEVDEDRDLSAEVAAFMAEHEAARTTLSLSVEDVVRSDDGGAATARVRGSFKADGQRYEDLIELRFERIRDRWLVTGVHLVSVDGALQEAP